MSTTFSSNESVSADELAAVIEDARDQQTRQFNQCSPWLLIGLFATPIDLSSEDDPSGLGGFITAPASFVDSSLDSHSMETDMQALRKDWVAIGNDLRIAILRHRLEHI